MDALIISNFLLWGVLLCLVLVILALSRQIGVLYERVAPMGALTMDRGPAVGEAAPRFDINDCWAVRSRWAAAVGRASCCSSCRRRARCARSCCPS